MILVTDLKTIERSERELYDYAYHYSPEYPPSILSYDDPLATTEVVRELIHGRRFRSPYGKTVIIGWDQKTQEVLGLPFETFNNYERRRQSDYEENTRLRKRLRELESETLIQCIIRRLKFFWNK